jgi:outer membrane protein
MKKLPSLILIGLLGLNKFGLTQDLASESFGLSQCLDYAMDHSQILLNSNLDIDISNAKIGEIRSAGLPQVDAKIFLNYNFELRKSILPAETFAPPGDTTIPADSELILAFGTKYDGDAFFQASQLLFDGSYFVGLQAARTYKDLSSKNFIKTRIDVVNAVYKAYYLVLINREKLVAAESNLTRLKSLLDETNEMYTAGFAEKIDVSRIQVNYNNLNAAKLTLERAVVVSEYLLKYQMGMPVNLQINFTGSLKGVQEVLKEKPKTEGFDYDDRIEYSILQTNEGLQELDIKNTKMQFYPNLYAIGRYGWNTMTNKTGQIFELKDRWLNYGFVGLQLSVPIFDGMRKRYIIQQSKIELQKVKNNFDLLENNINTEIRQNNDALLASLDQLDIQEQNMDLAKEIFEVTKTKFQAGIGSNIDLINADDSYVSAQVNYYDALYSAILSKITLEKSLGHLDHNN